MSEIKINEEFDFGFSATTEEEILNNSELLSENEEVKRLRERINHLIQSVVLIRNTIQPLLDNLLKDADVKPIINWPNRTKIINDFEKKIQNIVDSLGVEENK